MERGEEVECGEVERGEVERGEDVEWGEVERGEVERGGVDHGEVECGGVDHGEVERGGVDRGEVELGKVECGEAGTFTATFFSGSASLSTGSRVTALTSDSDNRSSLITSRFAPISLRLTGSTISGGSERAGGEWRVPPTDWSIPGASLLSSIWVSGSSPPSNKSL